MTDRIADLRKMVAEATTGPWNADGPVWNRVVYSSLENRICFMAHSNGLNDGRDIANSRLIYQAPTLATDLADALEQEAKLRAALIEGRRAIGTHHAPDDCYATGPMTGDVFRDLIQCPACSFIAMCAALGVQP